MRTFIAVPAVPPPALKLLLAEIAATGSRGKRANVSNLHLTLKFLGETGHSQLPDIQRAIDEAVAGEVSVTAQLAGLGAFPNASRPSVLWVGVRQGEVLTRIASRLESACASLGFAKESREFVPHLTLRRFKYRPPDIVFEMLEKHHATEFGPLPVETVIHFESELQTGGAIHTPLSTHHLGPAR